MGAKDVSTVTTIVFALAEAIFLLLLFVLTIVCGTLLLRHCRRRRRVLVNRQTEAVPPLDLVSVAASSSGSPAERNFSDWHAFRSLELGKIISKGNFSTVYEGKVIFTDC